MARCIQAVLSCSIVMLRLRLVQRAGWRLVDAVEANQRVVHALPIPDISVGLRFHFANSLAYALHQFGQLGICGLAVGIRGRGEGPCGHVGAPVTAGGRGAVLIKPVLPVTGGLRDATGSGAAMLACCM